MFGRRQIGRCLRRVSMALTALCVVALLAASAAAAAGPTVTINQAAGQSDPAFGSTVQFTVTFSEPVEGFNAFDVLLGESTASGTLVTTVTGGPAVYTVTVSGMTGSGSVVASIPAAAAVNGSSQSSLASTSTDNSVSWILDHTPPTVTIDAASGQASPTSIAPVFFTVRFSEPVTRFGAAGVLLSGSTTGGALAANIAGGPTLYSVAVSGMTSAGTVVATIPAGAALDLAGNPSTASTSTDNLVDWLPPATTGTGGSSAGASPPQSTLTAGPPTLTPSPARCSVPKLTSKTLKAAKAKLKAAHCALGTVTKRRGAKAKSSKVVKQSPKAGTRLPARGTVKVTLG